MNQEIKTEWLKNLRSGEYIQGKDRLISSPEGSTHGDLNYCCMGVLGKTCSLKIKCGGNKFEDDEINKDPKSTDPILYPILFVKTGLSCASMDTLAEMNDTHGKTFLEIADWIETNL